MRVSGKPLSVAQRKFHERLAMDGRAGDNQELPHCTMDGCEKAYQRLHKHPANGHPVERVRQGWHTLVVQAKQASAAEQGRAVDWKNSNAASAS